MSSINREIAAAIIAGKYDDDKPSKIVTYNNMFDGGLTFAVVFERDCQNKYEQSPACSNVSVVWTKAKGYTHYGMHLMHTNQVETDKQENAK